MPSNNLHQHKHAFYLNKYKPAGLLGIEMIQDVVLWAPGRSWSYVAAPGSQTYTKKEKGEKVKKVKYKLFLL